MCRHVELTANGLTTKHVIRAVAGLDFPVLKTKNRDDDHEKKKERARCKPCTCTATHTNDQMYDATFGEKSDAPLGNKRYKKFELLFRLAVVDTWRFLYFWVCLCFGFHVWIKLDERMGGQLRVCGC